jgi:long-chain acyl-CoA synthetase
VAAQSNLENIWRGRREALVHESLVHLLEASCRKYANRPHLGTRKNGQWSWITYAEFKELVDAARGGLAALGVGRGDRVALVADNCVEWATCAYAAYTLGAIFVPMYAAQPPKEWEFILNDCGAKVVFAATPKIAGQLEELRPSMPSVEHIICLAESSTGESSYAHFLEQGRNNPTDTVYPDKDEPAGFIYTSGTTGNPKGVKLSHANICSNCDACREVFPLHKERSLAFLPWAHALGQTGELHFFTQEGHAIAINDDVTRLVNNLPEVRPSLLVAVPRIFNRIYDGVNKQMAAKPLPIQKLFSSGLRLAERRNHGEQLSFGERIVLGLAERLIFSKVRDKFGGRLKLVISGSAALNPDVARFIDALGIMVYEGYGLTETSPVAAVNYPGARKIGSVGKPLPGVEIRIDESKSDNPGEGEIIIKGPNVMLGYYNRPEEDAAVFTEDHAFRTGDLGRLDEDGYLYITGRLKELYKLETGKYVAPAALEEKLKLSPYIANIMLFGSNKAYNIALVVPDEAALQDWSEKTGVTLGDVTNNPQVTQLIMAEIDRLATDFKNYEKPKKAVLLGDDFTTDNGMLTPSLKVKRREVIKSYQDRIDAAYA